MKETILFMLGVAVGAYVVYFLIYISKYRELMKEYNESSRNNKEVRQYLEDIKDQMKSIEERNDGIANANYALSKLFKKLQDEIDGMKGE